MKTKVKFTLLQPSFCSKCKKSILHEFGYSTETKKNYKQCIRCDTLTEVKSERQRNEQTSHNPIKSPEERSEDT